MIDKTYSCCECGGEVVLTKGSGRYRGTYIPGIVLEIPEEFETMICSKCGEELSLPEIADKLDALLEIELLEKNNDR